MQAKGTLMLLGAAFFWGTTFVAQLTGMDGLGPFSYAFPGDLIFIPFVLGCHNAPRRIQCTG